MKLSFFALETHLCNANLHDATFNYQSTVAITKLGTNGSHARGYRRHIAVPQCGTFFFANYKPRVTSWFSARTN